MIFLDSADINDVIEAKNLGISGVTTNPSLFAKNLKIDGCYSKEELWKNYKEKLTLIAKEMYSGHLSVEVLAKEPQEILKQAEDLRKISGNINIVDLAIKIPIHEKYMSVLRQIGFKTHVNVTACMTFKQAVFACSNNAKYVSFFYNRMKDDGVSTAKEIGLTRNFIDNNNLKTKIICGSIRNVEDFNCFEEGSHIITLNLALLKEALFHKKTEEAIKQFEKDSEFILGKS